MPRIAGHFSEDGFAAFFFLVHHGDVAIGTEPDIVAFDVRHQIERNEVVMALMVTFAGVRLGQLDAAILDAIDRPDWDAVSTDDLRMFLDES